MKSYPYEVITITSSKPSKITTWSTFLGRAGTVRSIGRIVRFVNTEFDTKHPILLDTRHTLVGLLFRSRRHMHFHQDLDYMCSVLNMVCAILVLSSIKNQSLIYRKGKTGIMQPVISNSPVKTFGYKQSPFNQTSRFAEAGRKDGELFQLASPPGLYTLRWCHVWTLALLWWVLNDS